MAKYDTYTARFSVEKDGVTAELELLTQFEEGDVIINVIQIADNLLVDELTRLKIDDIYDEVEP